MTEFNESAQPVSKRPAPAEVQKSLQTAAVFRGLSLFHGYDVTARCLPAEPDTGIVFRRTDLVGSDDIPAHVRNVARVPRRTAIQSSPNVIVETIEHLMAALAGLQIDNCVVEIDGPEVPSYDGSCRTFCDGLLQAGITEQGVPATCVRIGGNVSVSTSDGGQLLSLRPQLKSVMTVTYELDYGVDSPIQSQTVTADITPEAFYEQISAARTFVLEREITALKQMGYGRHLTAKDLVVVGDHGIIDNELRWPDEAARHKLLDCVGDLALCGVRFTGHVTASRSGHHLNHDLARTISSIESGQSTASRAA
ncbi:MAG: UDP-3-O-acyl-N-acetylglucosamine deacetylase [Planctomycetaceae bacterium]